MTNEKVAEARERIGQLNTLFAELAKDGVLVNIQTMPRRYVNQVEEIRLDVTFMQIICS